VAERRRRIIDKRSKPQLKEMYEKMKDSIPKFWRDDELSRKRVTEQGHVVQYLEMYGPLAALLYLRT